MPSYLGSSIITIPTREDNNNVEPNSTTGVGRLKNISKSAFNEAIVERLNNSVDGLVLEVSKDMVEYTLLSNSPTKKDGQPKKLKSYLCYVKLDGIGVCDPDPQSFKFDPAKDKDKIDNMLKLNGPYAPYDPNIGRAPRVGEKVRIIKTDFMNDSGEKIKGFYQLYTNENSFFDEASDFINSLRNLYDKQKPFFGAFKASSQTSPAQPYQDLPSAPVDATIVKPSEGEYAPDWPAGVVDSFYSVPRYGVKEKATPRLRKEPPNQTNVIIHFTDGRHEGDGSTAGMWLGWKETKTGRETFKKNDNTTFSELESSVAVHYYIAGDGHVRQTVKEKYQTDHDNNGRNSIGIEINGAFMSVYGKDLASRAIKDLEMGADTKGTSEGLIGRRIPTISNEKNGKELSIGRMDLVTERNRIEKEMLSQPDPGDSLHLADTHPKTKPMKRGNNTFVNPYFTDPMWPWNENTKYNIKMQRLVMLVYCLCKRYQIPMTNDSIFVRLSDHMRSGYAAGNGSPKLHIDVTAYFWWKLFINALKNFDESRLPESVRTNATNGMTMEVEDSTGSSEEAKSFETVGTAVEDSTPSSGESERSETVETVGDGE
jgi:hypothetical protein